MVTDEKASARKPLSRERVLVAAVELADESGLGALTMRALAEKLGVEAMSLYHHVANKDALLDGVCELVVMEISHAAAQLEAPDPEVDWKGALRARILEARNVMLRHRWAPAVIESRTTISPATMVYFNGVLEIFRAGGVSYDLAHHAMHALGSRAFGFSQELFEPTPGSEDEEISDEIFSKMASELPLLVEMLGEIAHEDPDTNLGWCDDQTEFEFALDLILDGLERLRAGG